MPLTGATIRAALATIGAVGEQIRPLDELARGATAALQQAPRGLTAAGAASFLATCAQESAYFRTTKEYGTGQWYAPWIGRGFVQVTHERNYRLFGRWCHARGLVADPDVFVKNRASLEDYRWAWLTAVWYFETSGLETPKPLWPYANRGDHYAVSQGVNRGPGAIGTSKVPNHWTERKAMFDAFRRAGDALLPAPASEEDDDMPTADEIARAVWATPIEDLFTPQGGDGMPAFAALGWAAAHGAHARQGAQATLSEIVGLRVAVERLTEAAGSSHGIDPATLQDAVRAGVAQALADSVRVEGDLHIVPGQV